MINYTIAILLLCSIADAQVRKTRIDNVDPNVELTTEQEIEQKENLRGLIFKEHIPVRSDYVDKDDRGRVRFNPERGINKYGRRVFKASNYSRHKVRIPDGKILRGINFSQKRPHTTAIIGKNLHFIECNLNNVELDPTWTFKGSLTIHSRYRRITEGEKEYRVYEVEKNDSFEEVSREEIITD